MKIINKKLLSIMIAFSLLIGLMPVGNMNVFAVDDEFEHDYITYRNVNYGNGNVLEVIGYTGEYTNIIIPAKVVLDSVTRTVIGIADSAFKDNKNLTTITIPNTVKNIGDYVFENCSRLTSVIIPEEASSIGEGAFMGCVSLESVTLSSGYIKEIKENSFSNCYNLKEIEIPASITSIGKKAFYNCGMLTKLRIPSSVDSIGESAFEWCLGIKEIQISAAVKSIGKRAFAKGENIEKIEILEYGIRLLQSIGEEAFIDCISLENIDEILDGAKDIGDHAFENCHSLTKVTISSSIETIGKEVFKNCDKLKDIVISHGLKNIGDQAFSNCPALENVELSTSLTSIGDYAFYYCPKLTNMVIPDNVESIGNNAFSNCSNLANITLPKSLKSIEFDTFLDCTSLIIVTIPENVKSIDRSFQGCTGLKEVNILGDLEVIDNGAFSFCSSLEEINLPESMTTIGARAFAICSSLDNINIPDNVSIIGEHAFGSCSSLSKINIPDKVKIIPYGAFGECANLGEITFSATSPPSFGGDVFSGTPANKIVYVPSGSKANYESLVEISQALEGSEIVELGEIIKEEYEYEIIKDGTEIQIIDYNGLDEDIIIPQEFEGKPVTIIGNRAFMYKSLKSVTIPSSVISIEDYAFYGNELTKVTIPHGVTRIGRDAFRINKLIDIIIPNSITTMGEYAFCNNELTSVQISSSIDIIRNYAFADNRLTIVEIPNGVTTIEYAAFNENQIHYVLIPDSVTTIGGSAFEVNQLTTVTIPGSVTTMGKNIFRSFPKKAEDLTIYGELNSTAQEYANSVGHIFIDIIDRPKTHKVIAMIANLPEKIELEDKAQIEAVKLAYDALSAEEKGLVVNYNKLVLAENAMVALENIKLVAPVITTTELANGKIGTYYTSTLAAEGDTPMTWSIVTGSLPAGLTLNNSTGVISGTPTIAIKASFSIKANNNAGDFIKDLAITIVSSTNGENYNNSESGNTTYIPKKDIKVNPPINEETKKPEIPEKSPVPHSLNFKDVKENEWSFESIKYVRDKGLMIGTDDNNFSPNEKASRGMIVTILYRLEGNPKISGNKFTDVLPEIWYTDAVSWATDKAIVKGYGNGLFGPNNDITREQLVTVLYNYAKYKGYNVSNTKNLEIYTDNMEIADWAKEAMEWGVKSGIILGKTKNTLNPTDAATRAEMATILERFIEKLIK